MLRNWRSPPRPREKYSGAGPTYNRLNRETGRDVLKSFPHPGLRVALRAPQGYAPTGVQEISGKQENQKTNPTSSDINLLQQENGLDLGVHLSPRKIRKAFCFRSTNILDDLPQI